MDLFDIIEVLHKNYNKEFVDRIINKESAPILKYDNDNYATHKMSWSDYNNKYIVYPTIINNKGKLKELKPDEAYNYAINNNEFIEFDSPELADWFSKNYKQYWNK